MQSIFSLFSPYRYVVNKEITKLEKLLNSYNKKILEIGCGKNSYKKKFPKSDWTATDINFEGDADLITDATDLKFSDNQFDVIICISVLEHIFEYQKALKEIRRVLKKKGILILSTPFIFPYHDYPGDYWRFSDQAIKKLLKDYKSVKIKNLNLGWWRLPSGIFAIAKK